MSSHNLYREPRVTMDELEKRVLKRRKPVLTESLQLTDDIYEGLKTSGLLSLEHIQQIKMEQINTNRVNKMLDLVVASSLPDAFTVFCSLLANNYGWMSKDMEADLRMERGDFEIPDDILKEASTLVHRKFGTSKRLCEADKKDMTELLAIKLLINKEEWEREMDEVNSQLKSETLKNESKDSKTRKLSSSFKKFVKNHEKQLATYAHGMTSTSQALQLSFQESHMDQLGKVQSNVDKLLDRLSKILANKDALAREREKCMRILGEKDDKASLDEVLTKVLNNNGAGSSVDKLEKAVLDKERDKKRLNKRVTDLEHDVMEKDERIAELEKQLAEQQLQQAAQQQEAQMTLARYEQELDSAKRAASVMYGGASNGRATKSANPTRRLAGRPAKSAKS